MFSLYKFCFKCSNVFCINFVIQFWDGFPLVWWRMPFSYISLDFKAGVYNSERCDDRRTIDGRYRLAQRVQNYSSYLPKAQSFCQVQRQIRINRILYKARTRDDNGNLINEMNSVNLLMTFIIF